MPDHRKRKLTREERIEHQKFFQAVIARAAQAGHQLPEEMERVRVSKNGYGLRATCSCGWVGTNKSKRFRAWLDGFMHLGEAIGIDVRESLTGGGVSDLETVGHRY